MKAPYNSRAAATCRVPVILGLISVLISFGVSAGEVVNVYSARQEALIKPLLERFSTETGIEVNLITGKDDELLKRLQVEGEASPADILITVDAGRLHRAKEAGVLQPITSEVLERQIPAYLRDPQGFWFGLSKRARVIVYVKDKVSPSELSTYEALGDEKWKGRICIRSSSNIYNQSLVASMIDADGAQATEAWAKKLVANFAKPPAGGDTDQMKTAAAGGCDLAVVNTYYFARLLREKDASLRELGERLALFWPNQGTGERGTHVNVSGGGVTAHSKHVANATRLLEFLVSEPSQAWYAKVNNEYPVVAGVPTPEVLQVFGEFRSDEIGLDRLGENNRQAVELMDRAGWQ